MARFLLIIVIFIFYLWTSTNGKLVFDLNIKSTDSFPKKYNYNYLVKAFINHKLSLPIKVPEGLKNLQNPYNPEANKIYRESNEYKLHDLILYNEKLYLYTGLTPLITLYLPYYLLTKSYLPDNLATFIYMFGSFIWATLILFYLKNKYFKATAEWMICLAILVLGISNIGGYILRFPETYHVAISGGCFFLTGAIYLMCIFNQETKQNFNILFLTSTFIGLAVGSRPYFFLSGIVLIILLLYKIFETREKHKIKSALALLLPFILIISLLATYNYLRFGNITEFGYKYIISLFNVLTSTPFNIKYLTFNFYDYMFKTPIIKPDFPFIFMNTWTREGYPERIVGIIPCTPFFLLFFLYPIIYFFQKLDNQKNKKINNFQFPYFEFLTIFLPACLNFGTLLMFHYVTMRYTTDFITPLLLSTIIIWFYFDLMINKRTLLNTSLKLFIFFTTGISLLTATIFSITGCAYTLENHMDQIKKFEQFYLPISRLISKIQK